MATIQEVDATNLSEVRAGFEAAVKQATFIAFDCEFTGLHREQQQGGSVLQDMKTRYAGIRQTMFGGAVFSGKCRVCHVDLIEAAQFCHHCGKPAQGRNNSQRQQQSGVRQQDFLICQVGLSLFTRTESGYSVKVYSFYISPRPFSANADKAGGNVKIAHDIRFGALGSSLKFLGDHQFDFGRWINDGLPFMSRQLWTQEKEKLQQRGQFDVSELEKAKGFLDVWDMVLSAGKPLVGHQCFLDILYLWHQLEGPLQKDLPELLREVSRKVRVTVDTKHMLTWYPRSLSSLLENTGMRARQRTLLRLRRDLELKVQRRENQRRQAEEAGKSERDRVGSPLAVGDAGGNSRPPTPQAVGAGSAAAGGETEEAVPPRSGSPGKRAREKEEERTELLRKQTDALDKLRELHCSLLQRSLGDEDKEGNKFRTMQLQDVYKLMWPFVQDLLPPPPPQREHDAGYDAWMTGCLFLALFNLMNGREATPTTEFLIQTHWQPTADVMSHYNTAELGAPASFPFVNRIFVFAAPYFLDTSSSGVATRMPSLVETHLRTFVVDQEGTERMDLPRFQRELRGVDPYSDLYWVEYGKKAVVVMTGLGKGRRERDWDDADEAVRALQSLQSALRALPLKVTPVSTRLLSELKARAAKLIKPPARQPAAAPAKSAPAPPKGAASAAQQAKGLGARFSAASATTTAGAATAAAKTQKSPPAAAPSAAAKAAVKPPPPPAPIPPPAPAAIRPASETPPTSPAPSSATPSVSRPTPASPRDAPPLGPPPVPRRRNPQPLTVQRSVQKRRSVTHTSPGAQRRLVAAGAPQRRVQAPSKAPLQPAGEADAPSAKRARV
eukprot:Hpha_TRINITY_DN10187_c0_g1::TRINITY_DN10187_c0_g1_i2::g.131701::m.131701